VDEGVEIGSANKDVGNISRMMRAINDANQFGLTDVFTRLRIEGAKDGQRLAFAPSFIQDRILKDGELDALNPEARRIVYLLIETGLRLSEATNLTSETIKLTGPVPHVQVRPDGRAMKTEFSRRDIPLVGVALEAMKLQPNGFPRYRDKAASLSALVNKSMEARGLRPKEGQSLYSLRHAFEDRLTAVEAPEKVIAVLMGHRWSRPRYGVGPSLDQLASWLKKIAFRAPATV
jgi:integrase